MIPILPLYITTSWARQLGSPQREKKSQSGAKPEGITHSHCPCPSAETATTGALQKGKEKKDSRSTHEQNPFKHKQKTQKEQKLPSLSEGKLIPHLPFKTRSVGKPSHYGIHILPSKKNNASEIKPYLS